MVENNPQSSGRIVAGRYRLGLRLGSGVDVAAFEAFDEQAQKMVVLKVVHPDLGDAPEVRRRFRATMAAAAGVTHANVAPVLDFGADRWGPREVLYVVTERFGGGSLRDMLDRGRLLSPSQALIVGLDACKGLDAVHRAGLVHADVRPSTLVFGEDRRVRLVDVGLGHLLASVGRASAGDNERVRYASPERALGLADEPKGDVYALCLTLIEAVTGSVPFEGDSAVATLSNRIDRLMPVSADLGPLAAVFERAGRPGAEDRYTAAEFGRALVQAAEKLPRPEPLPIIGGSLFAPETSAPPVGSPAAPTEPVAAVTATVTPAAVTTVAPVVTETLPPTRAPRGAASTPTRTVPVPADAADTELFSAISPRADDDVDVDLDEYPEPPPPSGRMRKLLVVALLVLAAAGGALAWYISQPQHVTVPNLVGVEKDTALNQIAGDLNAEIVPEPNEDVEAGVVIRTDPAAGQSVEKNSTLTLYVSSGPAPRVLPELNGLTLAEATKQLTDIDLTLTQGEPVYDDTVEEGKVVSWSVPDSPGLAAGGTVVKGTEVEVVLSKGPNPTPSPDVTGQTYEQATATLETAGFVIARGEDVFNPTIAAGLVAEQDPPIGTEVQKGGTITVKISKGPELVALPDPTGLKFDGIVAALQAAGFVPGPVTGKTSLAFVAYHVNGAVAAPGTTFPKGTTVELFFKTS